MTKNTVQTTSQGPRSLFAGSCPRKSRKTKRRQIASKTSGGESFSTLENFDFPSTGTSTTTLALNNPLTKVMDDTVRSPNLSGRQSFKSPRHSTASQRPSMLSRLKSSMSTWSVASQNEQRKESVVPSDFLKQPEQPERHFIDSIGMVIPGVSDREQCNHPISHFVVSWRLCQPIEYSTALADHGITYSDYQLLLDALANFLQEHPSEPKPVSAKKRKRLPKSSIESREQANKTNQAAQKLDELLVEITTNLRTRGLAIMICIHSFSLFVPNRFSEAHVQILHVPLGHRSYPSAPWERLTFLDPLAEAGNIHELGEIGVSTPRRRHSDPKRSDTEMAVTSSLLPHPLYHHHMRFRDRSRALPLWPSAIPTTKRALIDAHAGRYGVDPYFREYMRASVNSRTNSVSYAKFLIERDDNPWANTRVDYRKAARKRAMMRNLVTRSNPNKEVRNSTAVNCERYEHNRRLECRKSVEYGWRLRLARFGFRHPLHPPHTPEMAELGLTKNMYDKILSDIDEIRQNEYMFECAPRFLCGLSVHRRRTAAERLAKVSEYIRKVNREPSKVVWTIEKIPGVYEGWVSRRTEWEVSVWNREDGLDLLTQLEKWGVIEKKMGLDDDDNE